MVGHILTSNMRHQSGPPICNKFIFLRNPAREHYVGFPNLAPQNFRDHFRGQIRSPQKNFRKPHDFFRGLFRGEIRGRSRKFSGQLSGVIFGTAFGGNLGDEGRGTCCAISRESCVFGSRLAAVFAGSWHRSPVGFWVALRSLAWHLARAS